MLSSTKAPRWPSWLEQQPEWYALCAQLASAGVWAWREVWHSERLHCLTGFNLQSLAFLCLRSTANTVTSIVNKKIILTQPSARIQTRQCHQHFPVLMSTYSPQEGQRE